MKRCVVQMRDGTVYRGPLWYWRPAQGTLSVIDEERDRLIDVALDDCVSAVHMRVMLRAGVVEDVDLLAKARAEGWQPKPPPPTRPAHSDSQFINATATRPSAVARVASPPHRRHNA